jgi:hypothetical protein
MKLTLQYDIGDGPVTVSTNLYVIVAWERRFKRKASEMATAIGMEDLAFMAWEASKLHGAVVPAEFDTFLKKQVSVIEVVDQDDTNPTPGEPTDTN